MSRTAEPGENSPAAIATPELTFACELCQLPAAQTAKHQGQGTDYKAATLPSVIRFWLVYFLNSYLTLQASRRGALVLFSVSLQTATLSRPLCMFQSEIRKTSRILTGAL